MIFPIDDEYPPYFLRVVNYIHISSNKLKYPLIFSYPVQFLKLRSIVFEYQSGYSITIELNFI